MFLCSAMALCGTYEPVGLAWSGIMSGITPAVGRQHAPRDRSSRTDATAVAQQDRAAWVASSRGHILV
jgi:hypothetical protein